MGKIVAVDFDGVIHDYKNPIPGRRMGGLIPGTLDALMSFGRHGFKIIVFTVWGDDRGREVIAEFMKYYQLPFDEITNTKPKADYYIDDKGIHFTTWEDALAQIIQ